MRVVGAFALYASFGDSPRFTTSAATGLRPPFGGRVHRCGRRRRLPRDRVLPARGRVNDRGAVGLEEIEQRFRGLKPSKTRRSAWFGSLSSSWSWSAGMFHAPVRPATQNRELGHGLPPDEQPDEDVRGRADRPPAVWRERVPVRAAARGERERHRNGDQQRQHARGDELQARGDAQPEHVRDEHDAEDREPDRCGDADPRAGQRGDVEAADQRHRGGAGDHRRQEPAARDQAGPRPEARADVLGDAARDRHADAERGEGHGERRGQHEQPDPREQRGGAGRVHRERGHEQHARADERADVERGAVADSEMTGRGRRRHASSVPDCWPREKIQIDAVR